MDSATKDQWTSQALLASTTNFDELSKSLTDPLLQNLFRLFCHFSEAEASNLTQKISVFTLRAICCTLARQYPQYSTVDCCSCYWDEKLSLQSGTNFHSYNFRQFLSILKAHFPERQLLIHSITNVLDFLLYNVLKKGTVLKPEKCLKKSWIPYCCVLTPEKLILNTIPQSKKQIIIILSQNCSVKEECRGNRTVCSVVGDKKDSVSFAALDPTETPVWSRVLLDAIRTRKDEKSNEKAVNSNLCQNRKESLLNTHKSSCPFVQIEDREPTIVAKLKSRIAELARLIEEQKLQTKDEEIVRKIATRMLDEERSLKEQAQNMYKESAANLDAERQKTKTLQTIHEQRTMQIMQLKEHLIHLTEQLKSTGENSISPQDSVERRNLLDKLISDSEKLLEHQQLATQGQLEEQQQQKSLVSQSEQTLKRLIDNSKQRNNIPNGNFIEINKMVTNNRANTSSRSSTISSPSSLNSK